MYRIVLVCNGVPASVGDEAASCIEEEFALHRRHHKNVRCTLSGGSLTLTAENDCDGTGSALVDEFSDLISACIAEGFDEPILIRSIINF